MAAEPPPIHFLPYRQSADSVNKLALANVPPRQTIAVGDFVAILRDDKCLAAGKVSTVNGGNAEVVLDWLEVDLPAQGTALVIPQKLPSLVASSTPPEVFLAGMTNRVDLGIAPVVRSVETQAHRMAVVRQQTQHHYGLGDRLDFYRSGRYAGFGTIVDLTPNNAMVEIMSSLSPQSIEVGDVAVRRLPAGLNPKVRGYLFRAEANHALVSVGEADGIEVGQLLFGRSRTGEYYRLEVERVYGDHCAAREVNSDEKAPMSLWDPVGLAAGFAVAIECPARNWRKLGEDWLVVVAPSLEGASARDGDFVYCREQPPGVGIVLTTQKDSQIVFVSSEWTLSPFEGAKEGNGDKPKTDTGIRQPSTQAVDGAGGL